jgi:hypothetical protein
MKKINYYIGSNNQTHILETEKALTIFAEYYEGMTTSELVGYWKGSREKTLLVSIVCETVDYPLIKTISKRINNELQQEATMVEVLDSNTLFIDEK